MARRYGRRRGIKKYFKKDIRFMRVIGKVFGVGIGMYLGDVLFDVLAELVNVSGSYFEVAWTFLGIGTSNAGILAVIAVIGIYSIAEEVFNF